MNTDILNRLRVRLIRDVFGASVLTIAVSAAYHAPANAQRMICEDRDRLIDILGERFDETQRGFGLQNDGRVFELYASPDGSWTAVITMPDGTSCLIAAGEAWTTVAPEPAGDPT